MSVVGEGHGARDELDDLVERAWPEDLDDGDRLALARLSPAARRRLGMRLLAILDWTEPLSPADRPSGVPEAAARAGLGVSQFHALVAHWRRDRTISALGVHAADRRPRAPKLDETRRAHLVREVQTMLSVQPGIGAGTIRRRLIERGGDLPSPATLLRLIGDSRRSMPPGDFGCRLVLDSAGLDLVDPEGFRLRLHAAIDEGTGLVLGWAVGTDRSMSLGHVWAAEDAIERLPSLDVRGLRACPDGPALDVRFAAADVEGRHLLRSRLGLGEEPRASAERIQGRVVVRTLGERLDRVWLGSGWRKDGVGYRTGKSEHLPIISGPIASGVDAAIGSRNSARLALVPTARAGRPPDPVGALARVRAVLEKVVQVEEQLLALPSYAWAGEQLA